MYIDRFISGSGKGCGSKIKSDFDEKTKVFTKVDNGEGLTYKNKSFA